MRLFHIDEPGCHHITEIMPGIKAVYQLEQEFHPYLTVEFLPHRDDRPAGIILLTKYGEQIRKYYTFKDPKDIDKLRNLIWFYLDRDYNIKKLPETEEGCINKFDWKPTNTIVQGWQQRKRLGKADQCCKFIVDFLSEEIADQNKKNHINILHEVYKNDSRDLQNESTCKKNRYQECADNFPPNTYDFQRCADEVTVLCEKGYSKNSPVKKKNKIIGDIRRKLWSELEKNNMKVDKKLYDDLITAGFFDHVGYRMGNKSSNIENVKQSLQETLNESGFYGVIKETFDTKQEWKIPKTCIIFLVISIVLSLIKILEYKQKN